MIINSKKIKWIGPDRTG